MRHELVVALRSLLKQPAFAVSVVLTLALGIGASTTMFSVVDAALLKPPAFEDPDRLVVLLGVAGPDKAIRGASFPEIADWRSRNRTLSGLALYDETSVNLETDSGAVRVEAEMVSGNFFSVLGVAPAIGRTFGPEDDRAPDASAVAVISHALWRDRFAAKPDALSRPVRLNDRPFTIVGVMPEGFAGLSSNTDLWFPSMMVSLTSSAEVIRNRGTRWLGAIGRLAPAVIRAQAQRDLARVASSLEADFPDTNRERGVRLLTLQESRLGSTGTLLKALFAAVLLFLLVACANVSSLGLARAATRRRELALRLALGARRWHLLRLVLAESFVLAAVAAVGGALLAAWGTGAALALLPADALPAYVRPSMDPRVLAFVALTAVVCAALVAALPAILGTGSHVSAALKAGARSAAGGLGTLRRPSAQQVLVVFEIALATTLLAAAGLMAQSFRNQLRVRLGFDAAGVTVAQVTLPVARYPPAQRIVFADRLIEALERHPGVQRASIGSDLPLTGSASASILTMPDGRAEGVRYYRHFVTPDFFRTLGIRLLRGRSFTRGDRLDAPPVGIVNESGARRLFGGGDPVGRRFRLATAGPEVEVVGVTADARYRDLTTDLSGARSEPDLFFPLAQRTDRDLEIAVRTADGQPAPQQTLRDALAQVDASLPVYRVRPLSDVVSAQTAAPKAGAVLLSLFSLGAAALTAIGLYGLVWYVVGLSRREIAIRLALGATRASVESIVVRNGMTLAAMGLALGVGGAASAGHAIASQLYGTGVADVRTMVVVVLLVGLVAAMATWLPAHRAARLDPHAALRAD